MSIPKSSKFYIVIGSDEGQLMTGGYQGMLNELLSKDLNNDQLYIELVEGGRHNEAFWAQQYIYGYTWLME